MVKGKSFADIEKELRIRLAVLSPVELDISDFSHLHTGHGADGAHVSLSIASASFRERPLLARHRMVYQAVGDLVPGYIHALSINAYSPEEREAADSQ